MIKYKWAFVIATAIFFLPGCNQKIQSVSQYPMLTEDVGIGPWQIVTYEGDKVYHETIALDGKSVTVRSESVYISNKSQFVYRDGKPITTYDGKYIYWNKDGQIINRDMRVVPEDQLFVVNKIPMAIGTAMRLRDYHKATPIVTLTDIDKAG